MGDGFTTYSDASVRQNRAGIALVVCRCDSPVLKLSGVVHLKGPTKALRAELLGVLYGVRATPRGAPLTAVSDLSGIEQILSGEARYAKSFPGIVAELNREIGLRATEVVFAPSGSRSRWYGECHREARRRCMRSSTASWPWVRIKDVLEA